MKYAVIQTGGKQYIVEEGQTLAVERLAAKEGEEINFNDVLLVVEDKKVTIGTPRVEEATVSGRVLEHGSRKKVRGLKYKRGGHRVKFGHRQPYSKVEVLKISTTPLKD